MQHSSIAQVKADPQGMVDRYRAEFGDEFNPDNAAELFADYSASPQHRARNRMAVAAAGGWVVDEAFRQRLAEPDRKPVLFTAGGTASGKSTAIAGGMAQRFIIFDSTFSNYPRSKARLQQALDAGREVLVQYVYRDPVEAYEWAMIRAANEGQGRVVTPQAHAYSHEGAAKTAARLAEEFAGNPRVLFRFFENSTAAGLQPGTIDLTRKGDYDGLSERLAQYRRKDTIADTAESPARGFRPDDLGPKG